jgi:hypothetical protein
MLWSQFAAGGAEAVMPEGTLVNITRMFSMFGFMGGTLLFVILTIRANVFPRWVPGLFVLMILSIVIPVEDNKWFAFFWGLTYVGMGYCIWANKLKKSAVKSADRAAAEAVALINGH